MIKLSVKTVSHAEFPLQYFLTWLEPSNTELPSVLPLGASRENRYLSTPAKIQPWCDGLVLVGALGEQFPTQNDKLTKFSTRTDSCLGKALVKEIHSGGNDSISFPWLV